MHLENGGVTNGSVTVIHTIGWVSEKKYSPGTKVARHRRPRRAKKSSHHHCLWRTKRNTISRTKVTAAASRKRASDESVRPIGQKIGREAESETYT